MSQAFIFYGSYKATGNLAVRGIKGNDLSKFFSGRDYVTNFSDFPAGSMGNWHQLADQRVTAWVVNLNQDQTERREGQHGKTILGTMDGDGGDSTI